MLRNTALILIACLCFAVTLMAASKTSVDGRLFWNIRLVGTLAAGFVPPTVWLLGGAGRDPGLLGYTRRLYLFSLLDIALVFPALMLTDHAIDPSLVSNRSYGTPIGSLAYLLPGYVLWYFGIYRRALRRAQG